MAVQCQSGILMGPTSTHSVRSWALLWFRVYSRVSGACGLVCTDQGTDWSFLADVARVQPDADIPLCYRIVQHGRHLTLPVRLPTIWSTNDIGRHRSSWYVWTHLIYPALQIYAVCLMAYFLGQLKLKAASVAVVGAGGLGCPALQYLAAAGVGK